jgi:hypothetical protein
MNFRTITGLLALLLLWHAGRAQVKPSLVILSQSKPDGVWLRWAPVNPANWQLGNKYGYQLERFTLRTDGEMEPNSQVTLRSNPLKPMTEAEFKQMATPSDEVTILRELLYGTSYQPALSGQDISSVLSKNKEMENRFGMALLMSDISREAATVGGLFWKDASAEKGKRYIYRIRIATTTVPLEPGVIMVSVTDPKPLTEVKDLRAQFGDRKVTLSWPTLLHKGIYSAYYVERSTDGKNFTKLSNLPYVHMSEKPETETAYYVDSLTSNQATYYYRIQGISPFAEQGPYSNVVSGQGKEDLTGLLIIREGKASEARKVRIAWEFPALFERDIVGFYVSSAQKPDGPYTDLHKKPLPTTTREYTQATPYNNTYYTLRAVDKNGKERVRSFPFLVQIADETPPAIPVGLKGSINQVGVASISWAANTDSDLLGYRVFRSNSLGEERVEVTKVILSKPVWVDTVNIRVLNKKIYYSVVAVDKNYNPSDYSVSLALNRPDVIAPTAPVFTRTEVGKDTITLAWIGSVSDDVAQYELTRIEKEERLSRRMRLWSSSEPLISYKDHILVPGRTYQYRITVTDSSGNTSESTSREIIFEPGYRPAVTELKDSVDREAKKIVLRWKNAQPASKCVVYRQVNEGPLQILVTLEGNAETFTDKLISANNRYVYKVQPVHSKGVKALLSKELKVMY